MKQILYIILIALAFTGCDKNFKDTGLANGIHDCTVWEYLHKDRANWDSAIVAIQHAGLTDIFNGTDPQYKDGITFFGFTNFSVSKFLYENQQYKRIMDIPKEVCSRMVLSHIIPGKHLQEAFEYEIKGTLDGGTKVPNMIGNELRIYRIRGIFNGTPDIGADKLGVHSQKYGHMVVVASCNIQANNGVVHSLRENYVWTEL